MILDNAESIRVAMDGMDPIARDAIEHLIANIADDGMLLRQTDALKRASLGCCAMAFTAAGHDLEREHDRFLIMVERDGAGVIELAVSIVAYIREQLGPCTDLCADARHRSYTLIERTGFCDFHDLMEPEPSYS